VHKPDEQYVVKLEGGVEGMNLHPELFAQIGRYVASYEPQLAQTGGQWLVTTDNPDEALGFPDLKEIHTFIRQEIGVRPWDGKPDRPITAYHISIAKRKEFKERGG